VWLAPLAAPVVLLAVVRAVRRRKAAAAVPLAVFGSVLAFEWALNLAASLFGFLRYQIMVVPLVVVPLGILLAGGGTGLRRAGVAVAAAVLGTSPRRRCWPTPGRPSP